MRYNDWAQATEQMKQQLEQTRAENAVLEKLNNWLIKQVETMQPQEIPLKETLRTMVAAGGIPENYVLPKGKCCDLEQTNKELTEKLEQAKNALQNAHHVNNLYHAEAQENGGVGSSFDSEQTEGFFDILREAMFELDSALMYAE